MMGMKPRKTPKVINPDDWSEVGVAGELRVEVNAIGAMRLVASKDSSWVILPWEVGPLAEILSAAADAMSPKSPSNGDK